MVILLYLFLPSTLFLEPICSGPGIRILDCGYNLISSIKLYFSPEDCKRNVMVHLSECLVIVITLVPLTSCDVMGSATRLGDLLDFGQLFKACGNN